MFAHIQKVLRVVGRFIIFAVTVLLAGVLVARWVERNGSAATSPAALAAAPVASSPSAVNSRSVSLAPGGDGHFRTDARVDGRRVGCALIPVQRARTGLSARTKRIGRGICDGQPGVEAPRAGVHRRSRVGRSTRAAHCRFFNRRHPVVAQSIVGRPPVGDWREKQRLAG